MMSIGFTVVVVLTMISSSVHGGKLLNSGDENPPTLLKAIQLLQLDTIKLIKKNIKDAEDANLELERRILIVEEEGVNNLMKSEQQKTQMKKDLERKISDLEREIVEIKEERTQQLYEAQTKCLPRAPQPTLLKPLQIDYKCEGQRNRSYSLACESGVCGTDKFPSCEEPVIWENVDVIYQNCQEFSFDNISHLCGEGWREERKTSGANGSGLWTELVNTPCSDCGDLSIALDWQPWGTCSDGEGNIGRPDRICRRRGNNKIGFQEEEKEYSFKSLGCWKDTGNRAIAELEGTDNRLTGNYWERQNAVEICFQVAKSKGYPAFAVQDGGWCAGSSTALETYNKYGESTGCSDGKGGSWANDVYQITYNGLNEFSCVVPWSQLSTGCYRFNKQPMTWSEAEQFCNNIQAKLVEIDSAEENRAIVEEMEKQGYKGKKMEFWIGLTDMEREGDWILASTGERPAYTNWDKNEPNSFGGDDDDCVHINSRYKFNDKKCNEASRNIKSWNALCETL